ncbi:hypothetical protein CANINC_003973 [Pichia inconspicua]|uniref:Amino-acid acetyltransferase, mitochondrial n=1 Tax=Pichia inconspicua TaxID=52247 RepID=A0A4V4NFA9_9ASCO|nr:hypothetical protein CANINC_003973 [[Candida] inconspicua]
MDFEDESNIVKHKRLSQEKKDLILTILNSTATKREARSYLSKYRLLEDNNIYKNNEKLINNRKEIVSFTPNQKYSDYIGKILDEEEQNLTRNSYSNQNKVSDEIQLTQTIRACILRIRRLDQWDENRIRDLGVVLKKAMNLGASPVIVVDGDIVEGTKGNESEIENFVNNNLERVVNSLDGLIPSRIVRGCFDELDNGELETVIPVMIGVPIFSGRVPIISPFVIERSTLRKKIHTGFGLTKETLKCLNNDPGMKGILSVEKVVFVDSVGGFPSLERSGSHVLINMKQEYNDIKDELIEKLDLPEKERERHLENLDELMYIMNEYPDVTGILTTPEMATKEAERQVENVTNPIIYNILTDRPTISSSLPVSLRRTPQLNTTVVKNGMPVVVHLSKSPDEGLDLIEMEKKGLINLTHLKYLIDDSFGRNLNMEHYLKRINGNVAGLIISGNYEGGAIITWEDSGNGKIAYLDKFAVVKPLQGIPGYADVVFKAMLTSFKDELLWRSRKNNPVNKWYFERSKANYTIPGTQWRMFITGTQDVTMEKLEGYKKICGSIVPSFDI